MQYEVAELELKARLENLTGSPAGMPANYSAYILPDDEEDFQLILPQAKQVAIGVVYRGSHFNVSESTDHIVQEELITFEINVMCKTKHGANGIYAAIEYVRSKLLGFKSPTGIFNRLSFKDVGMMNYDEGVWQWITIMGGETTITQDDDLEDYYPPINEITAIGNLGNTVVVPDPTLE